MKDSGSGRAQRRAALKLGSRKRRVRAAWQSAMGGGVRAGWRFKQVTGRSWRGEVVLREREEVALREMAEVERR